MSVIWNLSDIENLTRQVSGQLSSADLSNDTVDFYINSYYQYDLPRELKIEEFYFQWTFPTVPNVAVYDVPGDFTNDLAFTHVEPKLYINGLSIFYTQDTNVFYYRIPPLFSTELIAVGNGVTVTFPYTTQFKPIVPNQPSSVMITDGNENFTDNGLGVLTGSLGGSGTVNYLTGVISVTFNTAPVVNAQITVTYHYQQVGRPNTVLLYARQFTFFPTPDTLYQVRIDAFKQPVGLSKPTDVPLKPEWGEIIGIGAALKILRNFGQFDEYEKTKIFYQKERSKLMSDTDNQYMFMRAPATI